MRLDRTPLDRTQLDRFEVELLDELRALVRQRAEPRRHRVGPRVVAAAVVATIGLGASVLLPWNGSALLGAQRADASTVLLEMADATTGGAPASGTYWHTRVAATRPGLAENAGEGQVVETWIRKDGAEWYRLGDEAPQREPGTTGFLLCDKAVDLATLEALPPDPGRLRSRLTGLMRHNDDGPVPARARPDFVTGCTLDLLATLPTTPRVRSAAFRSLASRASAQNLGHAVDSRGRDGIALRFVGADDWREDVIIDPRSGLVLQSEQDAPDGGSRDVVLTATWTDTAPPRP